MIQNRLTFLAVVTAAIFGGCFGLFILATNLYEGVADRQTKIEQLKVNLDSADARNRNFLKNKRQVERVRTTALPGNVTLATNIYKGFLRELMQKHRFEFKQFTDQAARNIVAMGPRGQQAATVNVITYEVLAEVTMANLLLFLEDFYRLNIPHAIRGITIETGGKGNDAKLNVKLKVDVLSMPNVPDRNWVYAVPDPRIAAMEIVSSLTGAPTTGISLGLNQFTPAGLFGTAKLASAERPARDYKAILGKNVFSGLMSREAAKSEVVKAGPNRKILDETSLMSVTSDSITDKGVLRIWPTNKYVPLRAEGGINTFEVRDAADQVVLRGKVLSIKPRDIVFEAEGKFYVVHVGQFLGEAMKKELSPGDLKNIDPELATVARSKENGEDEKDPEKE